MRLQEYILKNDYEFWEKRGRKILYSAGSKLSVEEEVMTTGSGQESRYYYVYSKSNLLLGYYDKEDFFEIFMTLEEARDARINSLLTK